MAVRPSRSSRLSSTRMSDVLVGAPGFILVAPRLVSGRAPSSASISPIGDGHPKAQAVVLEDIEHRLALLLIDVDAKPEVAPQAITDADAVHLHMIDAIRRLDDDAGARQVGEPLRADPALHVERTVDLLGDRDG